MQTLVAVALAVAAAFCNATANVSQRKASRREPPQLSLSPKLFIGLIKQPLWLAGMTASTLSFILLAVALSFGALSVVQPIVVVELPLTLLGAAMFLGGHLGKREWIPIAAMTVGLAALLICLDPKGGKPQVPPTGWLLPGGVTLVLIVVLAVVGRIGKESVRALLMGAATGMAFGLSAALMKATTGVFASGGIVGTLEAWETYGAISFGIAGTWLYQAALHAGPLVASQPGITLLDPVVAIVLGWLIFGEQFRGGGFLIGAIAGGVAMSAGVIALGWSPLLRPD